MKFETMFFWRTVENIALIAGITYAAVSFGKWQLMFFYLVVLLNGYTVRETRKGE